ncbi:hypothetical protein JOF53_006905 [Crossiella equi]|uniref:Uncharacterized protein n=1 Tax=Crossiella equi TaxID=130796 RepID=A0ABS5AN79_9PSEU|nr:hypothetical protein [Crossiella equi]MBP2478033.1 hypothetical protein [Crossiella equi]
MGRNTPQPEAGQPTRKPTRTTGPRTAAQLELVARSLATDQPLPPNRQPDHPDPRLVLECPYGCGVTARGLLPDTLAEVMGVHVYLWHQWRFTADARGSGAERFEPRSGAVDRVDLPAPRPAIFDLTATT